MLERQRFFDLDLRFAFLVDGGRLSATSFCDVDDPAPAVDNADSLALAALDLSNSARSSATLRRASQPWSILMRFAKNKVDRDTGRKLQGKENINGIVYIICFCIDAAASSGSFLPSLAGFVFRRLRRWSQQSLADKHRGDDENW